MNVPSPKKLRAWAESYLKGTINQSDKEALESWYMSMPDAEVNWDDPDIDSLDTLRSRIFKTIESQIKSNKKMLHKKRVRYIISSAAILILFVGAVFFYLQYHRVTVKTEVAKIQQGNDIPPGVTQATLMLADGKKITLDSAHSIKITATKGSLYLADKSGTITCLGNTLQPNVYNTLVTRRGEQAPPLVLSDGTKIWINAASTLRFPVNFNGNTREVMLSGEAYFEVAKDAKHPFIVNTGTNKIQVLGTHFDVMAYNDEPYTYATLLKGSIRIINGKESSLLVPGQQGRIGDTGDIHVKAVDVTQSVAWLHGKLSMDNMDIKTFLRAVSRWYNVDISYKSQPPAQYLGGSLNKEVPLSQILLALNTYGIKCTLKDKQITVSN